MQTVLLTSAKRPALHVLQAPEFGALILPLSQAVQLLAPAADTVPAPQAVQTVLFTSANRPARQVEQEAAFAALILPASQGAQDVDPWL